MWGCARAITMIEFNVIMENLKTLNGKAQEYLTKFQPKAQASAAFITYVKNQAMTNNVCEQFNVKIVECNAEAS